MPPPRRDQAGDVIPHGASLFSLPTKNEPDGNVICITLSQIVSFGALSPYHIATNYGKLRSTHRSCSVKYRDRPRR